MESGAKRRRMYVWKNVYVSGHSDANWMDRNVTNNAVCVTLTDAGHVWPVHNAETWIAVKRKT